MKRALYSQISIEKIDLISAIQAIPVQKAKHVWSKSVSSEVLSC